MKRCQILFFIVTEVLFVMDDYMTYLNKQEFISLAIIIMDIPSSVNVNLIKIRCQICSLTRYTNIVYVASKRADLKSNFDQIMFMRPQQILSKRKVVEE